MPTLTRMWRLEGRIAPEAASKILGRMDVTLMDATVFDEVIASLDVPDPAPRLAAQARLPRPYTRK